MSRCAAAHIFRAMTPTVLRLRALREAAGLSQAALAKRVRVRRETLNRLENGKSGRVTLELLDRLATALGVQPGELVERRPATKKGKRVAG